ncbi:tetratricopeptide repeat protein [Corallococcus exercitus]|uniref:Tetratricopeptide repeat protein n=1 Tax=Corallococcus exercitus TaxID=2316736 RepID=A0A7Y4JRM4_9BACT|nr:tetratricopeptide repeat protein [Corallococcus exercitus]NOK09916.1 tetratricopeptide repeat protein [Corallococcus exercitus]
MHALPFPSLRRLALGFTLTVAPLLAGCGQSPAAERVPFTPATDSAVLEHVPATATDAKARERAALRRALAARADQLDLALRLARLDIEEGRASGDPRYLGRAQAALEPWWSAEQPPPGVRLLRATILQGRHEFPAALADLDALVRETPDDAQAWLTRAVVLGVRGEHAEAQRSCAVLAPLAGAVAGAVCQAQVMSLAGRSRDAYARLSAALARGTHGADEQAWALSTLAEAAARAGDTERATKLFARVLAMDPSDAYTRAAYADLLLDLGRPSDVIALTKDHGQDDNQLLRRVLAEVALGTPEAPALAAELASRHAASHLRGDSLHAREEARFALHVEKDAAKALTLARANWEVQHEPWDARILLEAALAHGTPADAAPVLRFLEASGADDPAPLALAERVRKALP